MHKRLEEEFIKGCRSGKLTGRCIDTEPLKTWIDQNFISKNELMRMIGMMRHITPSYIGFTIHDHAYNQALQDIVNLIN